MTEDMAQIVEEENVVDDTVEIDPDLTDANVSQDRRETLMRRSSFLYAVHCSLQEEEYRKIEPRWEEFTKLLYKLLRQRHRGKK